MKNAANLVGAAVVCALSWGCNQTHPTPVTVLYTVGAEGNYRSISAAIEAAPPGETIEIQRGTYNERVVISKPGIKLRGQSAIVDGAASGLDGRGIGMLVSGVSEVEISGFTVRNFERGIVLQNASNTILRGNDVYGNNSKSANTAPPLTPFDSFDGVVLLGSSNNQIFENVLHDNGHDGLQLAAGSRNNVIRGNRSFNNGAQTTPGRFG